MGRVVEWGVELARGVAGWNPDLLRSGGVEEYQALPAHEAAETLRLARGAFPMRDVIEEGQGELH